MAQGENQSPPFEHGQESGFGTLEQVPQDPSDPAGYQQIEEDSVERITTSQGARSKLQLAILLLVVGVVVFVLLRRLRG